MNQVAEKPRQAHIRNVDSTIYLLQLYKHDGLWCFDHPDMGIEREPFVEGMDAIIDRLQDLHAPGCETPVLIFSEQLPVLGPSILLMHDHTEMRNGEPWNLYYAPGLELEGWLCPVMLKFYPKPPAELHARLRAEKMDAPAARILR